MEAHWGTWTPWSWPPSALEPWWGWSLCHGSVSQECHTTGAVSHKTQLLQECDTQLGATPWLLVTDCQMRSVLSPQSGQCRYTVILYMGLDSTDMTVQCFRVHIACCFRNLVLHWSYINFSRCLDIPSMRIPACLSVVWWWSAVSPGSTFQPSSRHPALLTCRARLQLSTSCILHCITACNAQYTPVQIIWILFPILKCFHILPCFFMYC